MHQFGSSPPRKEKNMDKISEIFLNLPPEKQDKVISFLTRLLTYYPQDFFSRQATENKDQ